MTYVNPIWAEGQRKKWLRHDWRNWVKPEAHHLYEPLEEKRSLRFDEVAWQRKAEADAAREREELEQGLLELRWMVKDLRLYLAFRRLHEKFDPDQPRVPAGNPDGGQWTSSGASSQSARQNHAEGLDDESHLPAILVGQSSWPSSSYPVDLTQHELRGGHAIRAHVNRSREALIAQALAAFDDNPKAEDSRSGSFSSLEAATRLVNSTLAQNRDIVDQVARGERSIEIVFAQFESVTGTEVVIRNIRSQPFFRETYGVGVVIFHDRFSPSGYTIRTAFPRNR